MILESEARLKLCPFAVTFGASQQVADGPGPMCVTVSCMAWKWTSARQSEAFAKAAEDRARSLGYAFRAKADKEDVAYRNPPPGVDYDRIDGECRMMRGYGE